MDETQPTEPLPPQQSYPPQGVPPQSQGPQSQNPYGAPTPHYGAPVHPVAEPFYRRHGLAFAISTLVLAVLLLFGVVGVGAYAVSTVVFHAGSPLSRLLHENGRGGPIPVQPQAPGQNGGGKNGGAPNGRYDQGPIAKGVVRGIVAKISGSTWTIQTQRGATLMVDITSSTVYGVPGQSEKASDFAAGDEVIVVGTRSGSTVTALRILKVSALPLQPQKSPTPTPSPSS